MRNLSDPALPRGPFAILLAGFLVLPLVGCGTGGGGGGSIGAGTTAGTVAPGTWGVRAVTPAHDERNVGLSTSIRVRFGSEVDPQSLDASSFFLSLGGRVVATTLSVSALEATLAPRVALAPGLIYEVRVTTGVRSVQGQPLAQDFVSRFVTTPLGGTRGTVFMAGVGVADITPPVGVPLGGFGEGPRRLNLPDINPFNHYTFFAPSVGVRDPILAKALVLDDGVDRCAIVSLDLVASDMDANRRVAQRLASRGVAIDPNHIMTVASHTHSGPGAVTKLHFWELAAMDLYQPAIADALVDGIADAIERAVADLQPAHLGIGAGQLTGITRNRRASVSPHLQSDSIDPALGVIRIDRPDGSAIATVYNYAIHGLAYWWDNMKFSADLMGDASRELEGRLGGIALFANGAQGDITPNRGLGSTDVERSRVLGKRLADAVVAVHATIVPEADVDIESSFAYVDMGQPSIYLDSSQLGSVPGWLQTIFNLLGGSLGVAVPLPPSFVGREYRYQAIRLQQSVIASVPGEAIRDLGLQIKADGRLLGYEHAFVFGLSNGHMAYITTPREYALGGYEGVATLYGPDTGDRVRSECQARMVDVR